VVECSGDESMEHLHKINTHQWPTSMPDEYLKLLNEPLTTREEEKLNLSEEKNVPFGTSDWVDKVVDMYKIDQVMRGVGRPRNGG
jgi:hypothetical protein